MFPFLYVFFGILIAFLVVVDIISFALALLGFGAKPKQEHRNSEFRL